MTKLVSSAEFGREDQRWPQCLQFLDASYKRMYTLGCLDILYKPSLAIIGARHATPYGIAVAQMAGRIAAQSGIVVVSGGAMGVDYAAGKAALDAGGEIIIVSGCGADVVYPRSSEDIFSAAQSGRGVIVSCEPWHQAPRRYAFPKRNQIIAGLCTSLIVTEAGMPSGTFSTAQTAHELSKNVYAAPGSIFSPQSRGTNRLIELNSAIISDEVSLETLISIDFGKSRLISSGDSPARGRILEALVANPMRPDELALRLDKNILTIIRTLSEYEAKRLVKRLPDGRYSASEQSYLPTYCFDA
ncbi:MAG: DNA-processing protein DprA [Atopobium sp.]|uniref:DNA-processing protein DprA n=1 Tax=Atopobium sp. TaxID=1872650 RepID=UPI002A76483F|nr:DNA-processing protein DprA [Atopobium sp.]MDY2789021.1 DNA-processing protein DprA [Atopobium sp.]